jgi:hypothetical protein
VAVLWVLEIFWGWIRVALSTYYLEMFLLNISLAPVVMPYRRERGREMMGYWGLGTGLVAKDDSRNQLHYEVCSGNVPSAHVLAASCSFLSHPLIRSKCIWCTGSAISQDTLSTFANSWYQVHPLLLPSHQVMNLSPGGSIAG